MNDHNDMVTPELIVRKSAALFRAKSYHGTTMRDIGDAVGLDKSSLYYHFPSKQAILELILRDVATAFMPEILRIVDSHASPEEKLRELILNHTKILSEHQDELLVALTGTHGLPTEQVESFNSNHQRYLSLMIRIVKEGVESGVWKSDNPVVTALFVLGALNWMPYWYNTKGKLSPEEMANHLYEFVIPGLRSPSPGLS